MLDLILRVIAIILNANMHFVCMIENGKGNSLNIPKGKKRYLIIALINHNLNYQL